jgi:hypothetical protein
VLVPGGGGGGQSSGTTISWQHSLWLWPLPPPGRLTVYCEWPVARIGLTRTELDTAPLLAAAPNAVRLWHDEEPSAAHGIWASAAGGTSMTASPEPKPPEADEPDRAAELDALERALTEALRAVRRIR